MSEERKEFSLDAVRTDGWFERIGEGIGSFQALCEIVGERFFAFSIVVGARITALTVDRRNPDQTLVDFVVGVGDDDAGPRTAAPHARRLPPPPRRRASRRGRRAEARARRARPTSRPSSSTSASATCSSRRSTATRSASSSSRGRRRRARRARTTASRSSTSSTTFRTRIRAHVREELERVATGARSAIDLSKVAEAEAAAVARTGRRSSRCWARGPPRSRSSCARPKGRCSRADARALMAKGLGLLGSACVHAGRGGAGRGGLPHRHPVRAGGDRGRRSLPPARRGAPPARPCRRSHRRAPARGAAFGGPPAQVMPLLARAFLERQRYVAALALSPRALDAGVTERDIADSLRAVEIAARSSPHGLAGYSRRWLASSQPSLCSPASGHRQTVGGVAGWALTLPVGGGRLPALFLGGRAGPPATRSAACSARIQGAALLFRKGDRLSSEKGRAADLRRPHEDNPGVDRRSPTNEASTPGKKPHSARTSDESRIRRSRTRLEAKTRRLLRDPTRRKRRKRGCRANSPRSMFLEHPQAALRDPTRREAKESSGTKEQPARGSEQPGAPSQPDAPGSEGTPRPSTAKSVGSDDRQPAG